MTHSLHRLGDTEDLFDDFTIICMSARGYNDIGSQEKLRRFLRLAIKHNAVNFGNMEAGSALVIDPEEVIGAIKDGTTVQATFTSEQDFFNIVKDLVEEDLGMSVIIQGLTDKVHECCKQAGVEPHTWNNSLGVWGRTDLLPPKEIMEITTMCGHGMVAVSLVKKVIKDIKSGKIDYAKGVQILAKPCVCGFINPVRVARILRRIIEEDKIEL